MPSPGVTISCDVPQSSRTVDYCGTYNIMCVQIISNQNTLPKTKIALEKWWLGVGRRLFFWSLFSMIFNGYVGFREGIALLSSTQSIHFFQAFPWLKHKTRSTYLGVAFTKKTDSISRITMLTRNEYPEIDISSPSGRHSLDFRGQASNVQRLRMPGRDQSWPLQVPPWWVKS